MEFIFKKETRIDTRKRLDEIAVARKILIEVHNKYCEEKLEEDPYMDIDLFKYGQTNNIEAKKIMMPFSEKALLLEGMLGAYAETPDDIFFEDIELLVKSIKEEKERV